MMKRQTKETEWLALAGFLAIVITGWVCMTWTIGAWLFKRF